MKHLVVKALRDIGLDTPNAEAIVTFKLTEPTLIYEYVHAVAEQLRHVRDAAEDPRQGWLTLPEYQHIPVEAAHDTLEGLRTRIARLERRIKHYDYARRSPAKLKDDKRQLRELKRLEPKVATYFASDPQMTLDFAVQALLVEAEAPAVKQRRDAIKSRWKRNGKSTTSERR